MSNISKEKVGIQKLVEAIIRQAVVDIKSNFKKEDAFYFLKNYQKTFYNDIFPLSKDDMQTIIKQTRTRVKELYPTRFKNLE